MAAVLWKNSKYKKSLKMKDNKKMMEKQNE